MRMSRLLVLTTLTAMVACFSSSTPLLNRSALGADAPAANASQIERGKYLAHDVAMCVVCHSPRTEEGKLIETRLFQGGPIPVNSTLKGQPWATYAPNLRSIAEIWGEEDLAKFLQTGAVPHGVRPKLPMPPFRMNEEDAKAVTAYLRSLKK